MESLVQPSIYIKARPVVVFDLAQWVRQNPALMKAVPPAATTTPSESADASVAVEEAASAAVPVAVVTHEAAPIPPLPQEETKVTIAQETNKSSGDWKTEYERAAGEETNLKKQLQASQENVEVYKRLLQHSAASMDKWKRHEGMTELEAQEQTRHMLEHTQELNAELERAKKQNDALQQKLNVVSREKAELYRTLEKRSAEQRDTLAKLGSVEQQLEQNRQQLDKYRAVMVERAREYIKERSDDDVRQKIDTYRRSVEANKQGDETLKQLNLQGAAIMELLLQQRQLTQKLNEPNK